MQCPLCQYEMEENIKATGELDLVYYKCTNSKCGYVFFGVD